MQKIEAKKFFKIQGKFSHIPFSQSEGWYNYMASKKNNIVFFVDNEEDTKIAFWGKEQKIPIVGETILRIDGESYARDVTSEIIKKFYSSLLGMSYKGIEINSSNLYDVEYEIGIRRAGFKRPLGLFACPLTINVDIKSDFRFNRNWKRNIKKSNLASLKFKEIITPTEIEVNAFVNLFAQMTELKQLSYSLEPECLEVLINSKDMRTFLVYKNEVPVAARIIYDNKPFSCDVYAANGVEARNCGGSYFIMQKIFETLKEEGYSLFDFGRIPPSNHKTDNVYVFKNSSRGEKVQYNGEWVFYQSFLMEYLVHFFRRFVQKDQRY